MLQVVPQREGLIGIAAQHADQFREIVSCLPAVDVLVGLVDHVERGTEIDVPVVVDVMLRQAEVFAEPVLYGVQQQGAGLAKVGYPQEVSRIGHA